MTKRLVPLTHGKTSPFSRLISDMFECVTPCHWQAVSAHHGDQRLFELNKDLRNLYPHVTTRPHADVGGVHEVCATLWTPPSQPPMLNASTCSPEALRRFPEKDVRVKRREG